MERRREEITVHGRRFIVTIEGPDDARRYSAHVREAETDRPLTRNPIRGRSADDARDRALEVMHNLVGIARLQHEILAVADELAPGAVVTLSEDAQAVRAEFSGAWELAVPFAVARDEVADPDADVNSWRERIRAHFVEHLRSID